MREQNYQACRRIDRKRQCQLAINNEQLSIKPDLARSGYGIVKEFLNGIKLKQSKSAKTVIYRFVQEY